MQNILILEDCPNRTKKFRQHFIGTNCVIVDTAAAMKQKLLDPCIWELVMLDHDLGGETYVDSWDTNTGSEIVRFMIDPKNNISKKIEQVVVHSLNTAEAPKMVADLAAAGYDVSRIPFTAIQF